MQGSGSVSKIWYTHPITQWEMASLPFGIGGLSWRHAERLHTTACWSSCWVDTLPMIRQRHPQVADHILVSLSQSRGGFHLEAADESRNRLMNAGVDAPEWGDVDRCQRPGYHPNDEFFRFSRMGWQFWLKWCCSRVEAGCGVLFLLISGMTTHNPSQGMVDGPRWMGPDRSRTPSRPPSAQWPAATARQSTKTVKNQGDVGGVDVDHCPTRNQVKKSHSVDRQHCGSGPCQCTCAACAMLSHPA